MVAWIDLWFEILSHGVDFSGIMKMLWSRAYMPWMDLTASSYPGLSRGNTSLCSIMGCTAICDGDDVHAMSE
jgi:hypothetical protein